MVTIEPRRPEGSGVCSDEEECFRHHLSPNSAATLPPCANPKKCSWCGVHAHSDVKYSTTCVRRSRAGEGSGFGMSSPRGSKEGYHWKDSMSMKGILEG